MSKSSLSLRPKCDQKGHDTSSKEGLKRVRNNLENFTHFFQNANCRYSSAQQTQSSSCKDSRCTVPQCLHSCRVPELESAVAEVSQKLTEKHMLGKEEVRSSLYLYFF